MSLIHSFEKGREAGCFSPLLTCPRLFYKVRESHINRLKQGRSAWNKWREKNPNIRPDLRGADLSGANLSGQDVSQANLSRADLSRADLSGQNFSGANLRGANLRGANLSRTLLIETNFTEATLTNCIIYGIAAWNVQLEGAKQDYLIITPCIGYLEYPFQKNELTMIPTPNYSSLSTKRERFST